jgi:aryl-alcohol dehydrogenase-like predicted oxidoreductase
MVKNYLNEHGFRVVDTLVKIAEKHKAKPGQVALAWLMSRPLQTIPIASATSREQFDELVGAMNLRLDQESLKQLDKVSAE